MGEDNNYRNHHTHRIRISHAWKIHDHTFFVTSVYGYIFFRIGYWLKMKNTLKKKVSIFAISLLILGYGIGVTFNVTTDLFLLKMDSNYLLFFIPALCGSLLITYLSKYLQNKRYTDWLSYLGKNSLLIMCVHSPLILLVSSILLPALREFYSFIGKTTITDEAITSGRICGFLSLIILVPLHRIDSQKTISFLFRRQF